MANDLLKEKVLPENIYCISAQDAFLATRLQNYIRLNNEKPSFDELTWVQDFAKKAFGTRAKRIWESSDPIEILKDASDVAEQSQMALPLNNVIKESYKNAPRMAMQSALRDVDLIFTNIDNYFKVKGYFNTQYQMTQQELDQIKESLQTLEENRKTLIQNTDISLKKIANAIRNTSSEMNTQFEQIKKQTPRIIKYEIDKTIEQEKKGVNERYAKAVGKNRAERLKKLFILDPDYAQNKSEAEYQKKIWEEVNKEKDEDGNLKETNTLSLPEDEMRLLTKSVGKIVDEFTSMFETGLEQTINEKVVGLNESISIINQTIITNISDIGKEFGKSGIEIQLPILNVNMESTDSLIQTLNLESILESKEHTYSVESTTAFAGIKRWFGYKLDKWDWGYTEKTETYKELDIDLLSSKVVDDLLATVVQPMESKFTEYLNSFNKQMIVDLQTIQTRVEELVNELETAYEAEQLPYEEKKQRKDAMNDIDSINQLIQKDLQVVTQSLPQVLGI